MPQFKVNISGTVKRVLKLQRIIDTELRKASQDIGKGILANSIARYDHRSRRVLTAIKASGWKIRESQDKKTTILIGDMDILDRMTKKTAKATGKEWHLWRILHEGSGPMSQGTNKRIGKKTPRSTPWPIKVFVRSDDYGVKPGAYAPFAELLSLEGQPGIFVIRSRGSAGRAWFLENMQMFRQDKAFALKRVRQAMDIIKKKAAK